MKAHRRFPLIPMLWLIPVVLAALLAFHAPAAKASACSEYQCYDSDDGLCYSWDSCVTNMGGIQYCDCTGPYTCFWERGCPPS